MAPPSPADHEDENRRFGLPPQNCREQTVELRRGCIMFASIIMADWQSLNYVIKDI